MWYKTEAGETINLDHVVSTYLHADLKHHVAEFDNGKSTCISEKDCININNLLMENNLLYESVDSDDNDSNQENDIRLATIEVLGLSGRTIAPLKRNGINRVIDLYVLDTKKLRRISNMGPKSIEEITTKLEEFFNENTIESM